MSAIAQWSIMRAWAEHLPFDYLAAAEMSGLLETTVRSKAAEQGWIIRRGHRGRAAELELARLRDRLWARLEAATNRPVGVPLPKVDIDAIHVLLRAVDKLEAACQRPAAAESDEPEALAVVLDRINRRIVELATEIAGEGATVAEAETPAAMPAGPPA